MRRFLATLTVSVAAATGTNADTLRPGFTYQGHLKQNGLPVNGLVDLSFGLFDSETGGTLIGAQTLENVAVADGLFSAILNDTGELGANAWNGADRYLEISIDGVAVSPRQRISAVPYAHSLRPGGAATANLPNASIFRAVNSSTIFDSVGLKGESIAPSGVVFGVWGNAISASGAGVLGTSDVTSSSNASGVRGISFGSGGIGVSAFATAMTGVNYAVRATTSSPTGYAGYFTGGRNFFDGSVGIGTAEPGFKLDVVAGISNVARFTSNDSLGSVVSLTAGNGGRNWSLISTGASYGSGPGKFTVRDVMNVADRLTIDAAGNVGIGITSPARRLHLASSDSPELRIQDLSTGGKTFHMGINSGDDSLRIAESGVADRIVIAANGNVGIGTDVPVAALDVAGTTRTQILTITGGSDIAEPYNIFTTGSGECAAAVAPGMVVAIDQNRIGELRIANAEYDTAVAGIISGANGVNVGLTLTQEGSVADGQHPVAMTGRVWCWCDADASGPISAGDLLTTSATPGHAMKASDRERAGGATIGKAMSPLPSGRGLVLVLVNLQ